jgi:hypothetical protein
LFLTVDGIAPYLLVQAILLPSLALTRENWQKTGSAKMDAMLQ